MLGGDNGCGMSIDGESSKPVSFNSRPLVISHPSALKHTGQSSPFPRDVPNELQTQQKLQDVLKEAGEKLKYYKDGIRYFRAEKSKLKDSILDIQGYLGKFYMASMSKENERSSCSDSEEDTIQRILKYENSAAAIFYSMKMKPEGVDHPLIKDVIGVVATLGKVDDANLSRFACKTLSALFSMNENITGKLLETISSSTCLYLGLDTMLAVVCRTYEGVRALESYNEDGSINNGLGIHVVAASTGRPFADQFLVICLENLRLYPGELIANDPQQRLNFLKPRLISGETPPGFLGFAVNMITIDNANSYFASKNGYNLRETLFYSLFSNLQVYKSRNDMLKARPCLTHRGISLDGGIIRSPGVFSLGYQRCESTQGHWSYWIPQYSMLNRALHLQERMHQMKCPVSRLSQL